MRRLGSLISAATILVITAAASPLCAQAIDERRLVELAIGESVKVVMRDGRTHTAKLVLTSPSGIVLMDGRRQFNLWWPDIGVVERRARGPKVSNSTWLGMGVGIGVGLMALSTGGCTEDAGTFPVECVGSFAGLGAGAGALSAVILRAVKPSTVIYRAPLGRTLTLAPAIVPKGAAVFATIRW